ncbi:MAG TPA: NlpC/P60 family protein [Terriglobales bacterium]|nr:NlpC/P60 family protein [Terriglobales bacterium]
MPSKRAGLALIAVAVAWFSACRAGVRAVPPSVPAATTAPPAAAAPAAASIAVTRTGYTVQVGAFSVLANARRLAQTLNDLGLDAYHFPQGSGLYRVRFGDFPSREAAAREAARLLKQGVITDYFIVRPEDQPVYRRSLSGEDLRQKLVATAESFIGVDYTWGGTSRREGFDCSGLVRAVYQLNGITVPRSMTDQFQAGTPVGRDRLQKGDLVFFSGSPGRPISHVGIYVGENVFVHAPGKGKKVCQGSLDGPYFKERFSGARAYLNESPSR